MLVHVIISEKGIEAVKYGLSERDVKLINLNIDAQSHILKFESEDVAKQTIDGYNLAISSPTYSNSSTDKKKTVVPKQIYVAWDYNKINTATWSKIYNLIDLGKWKEVYDMHNSGSWSKEHYCCSGYNAWIIWNLLNAEKIGITKPPVFVGMLGEKMNISV